MNQDCAICLNEFEAGEEIITFGECMDPRNPHSVHRECAIELAKASTQCPSCRANIAPSLARAKIAVKKVQQRELESDVLKTAIDQIERELLQTFDEVHKQILEKFIGQSDKYLDKLSDRMRLGLQLLEKTVSSIDLVGIDLFNDEPIQVRFLKKRLEFLRQVEQFPWDANWDEQFFDMQVDSNFIDQAVVSQLNEDLHNYAELRPNFEIEQFYTDYPGADLITVNDLRKFALTRKREFVKSKLQRPATPPPQEEVKFEQVSEEEIADVFRDILDELETEIETLDLGEEFNLRAVFPTEEGDVRGITITDPEGFATELAELSGEDNLYEDLATGRVYQFANNTLLGYPQFDRPIRYIPA